MAEKLQTGDIPFVDEKGKGMVIRVGDIKELGGLQALPHTERAWLTRFGMAHNRFLGAIYTSLVPPFGPINLTRDRLEGFVRAMSVYGIKEASTILAPWRVIPDMWQIGKAAFGSQTKRHTGELGDFWYGGGRAGARAAYAMQDNKKILNSLAVENSGPFKRRFEHFKNFVENWNRVWEESTRFSMQKLAKRNKADQTTAEMFAREASFDPKLHGIDSDILKSTWLFINPSINSTVNMARALKNPKTALQVATGLAAITMALDKHNSTIAPNYREELKGRSDSNYVINKHLTLLYGRDEEGKLKYASLPLAYPIVPLKLLADMAVRTANGEDLNNKESITELADEFVDALNPTGGNIIPTWGKAYVDLARNRDGLGRIIRPAGDEGKNMSEAEKYHPWTPETVEGRTLVRLAGELESMGMEVSPENLKYLARTYGGGTLTFSIRSAGLVSKLWTGEELQRREIPLVRRLFGKTSSEAVIRQAGLLKIASDEERKTNTAAKQDSRTAWRLAKQYKDEKDPNKKLMALMEAHRTGELTPTLYKKLVRKIKNDMMGFDDLTYIIKNAPVKNGGRARMIVEITKNMDPQTKTDFLMELQEKGLITDAIAGQIGFLE
jgi:hypothetical protein